MVMWFNFLWNNGNISKNKSYPHNIIKSSGVLDGTAEVQAIKSFSKRTVAMTLYEKTI